MWQRTERRGDGRPFRTLLLLLGAAFALVPLQLVFFLWTHGDPPPTSLVWPRVELSVAQTAVRNFQLGNGSMAARLEVTVVAPEAGDVAPAPLLGTTYGSVSVTEAEALAVSDYAPGRSIRAMVSPLGELYVVRWRLDDILALAAIPLAFVMVPIGLFVLRFALE